MRPSREVEKKIEAYVTSDSKSRRRFLKNYLSTELKVYGLRTPDQRRIAKQGFTWSSKSNFHQLIKWNEIWNEGKAIETLSQPLFWLQAINDAGELSKYWGPTSKWVVRVENWLHSDQLSSVYSRMLESDRKRIYPVMCQWNRSPHPWKRRQSLVSLLYYARKIRNPLSPQQIFPLAEIAIDDPHFFVQRGLGWCLRECWQIYPRETFLFVKTRAQYFSPIAFATATEKMPGKKRDTLKSIRSKARC